MARKFKTITLISVIAFAFFLLIYFLKPTSLLLSLCITCGVFAYHFVMRLTVGVTLDLILKNRVDYTKKWFRPLKFEKPLYKTLKVKNWKKHIPTYSPVTFSPEENSLEQIAMATCQAELVHEIIVLLSFVPLLLIIPFGDATVFIITSLLAALIDTVFIILQRFNRPRILKIAKSAKKDRF